MSWLWSPSRGDMPDRVFQKSEGQCARRSWPGCWEASSQRAVPNFCSTCLLAVQFAGWSAQRHREALPPRLDCLGCSGAVSWVCWVPALEISDTRVVAAQLLLFSPAFLAREESPAQFGDRENPGRRFPCFFFSLLQLSLLCFCLLCFILSSGNASSTFAGLEAVWVYIHLANTLGFVEQKRERGRVGF